MSTDPWLAQRPVEEIVKARTPGLLRRMARRSLGEGGLADVPLAWLRINHDVLKASWASTIRSTETGKCPCAPNCSASCPAAPASPTGNSQFPGGGQDSDTLWQQTLENAREPNLWDVPEYRYLRPPLRRGYRRQRQRGGGAGHRVALRHHHHRGQNVFGQPLSGGDHAFDPSRLRDQDPLRGRLVLRLPVGRRAERPAPGAARLPDSGGRGRHVHPERRIARQVSGCGRSWTSRCRCRCRRSRPAWIRSSFTPLLDSLNGRIGSTRAATPVSGPITTPRPRWITTSWCSDSRLVGRSVWNTEWVMIIPGLTLNSDPDEGLDRFISQVTDIQLIFQTYGHTGN
jgi:hypothetical protein